MTARVHTVAVLAAGIYIGAPTLIVGAWAYLLRHQSRLTKYMARGTAAVLIVIASLVISLIPGRVLLNHDIAAATRYCESFIPGIETYRNEHGTYPLDISAIARGQGTPRLLRNTRFYWSDGQAYSFNFGDPGGMMNFVGYHSQTRQWDKWH